MVYNGYDLVYGSMIHVSKLCAIFNVPYDKNSDRVVIYDIVNIIDEILSKQYELIKVKPKHCCYNDGIVFIGYYIGSTHFVYRDEVCEYKTFNKYHNKNSKELSKLKKTFKESQLQIKKEFVLLRKEFPKINKPKFYTFANDCESCT